MPRFLDRPTMWTFGCADTSAESQPHDEVIQRTIFYRELVERHTCLRLPWLPRAATAAAAAPSVCPPATVLRRRTLPVLCDLYRKPGICGPTGRRLHGTRGVRRPKTALRRPGRQYGHHRKLRDPDGQRKCVRRECAAGCCRWTPAGMGLSWTRLTAARFVLAAFFCPLVSVGQDWKIIDILYSSAYIRQCSFRE